MTVLSLRRQNGKEGRLPEKPFNWLLFSQNRKDTIYRAQKQEKSMFPLNAFALTK